MGGFMESLILCCPLLLPSVFPSIRAFSNQLALHIRRQNYWSFSFSIGLHQTEDDTVRLYHRLSGHEPEQTLGDSEGMETWHAAVHGVARTRHDLATEQQQSILTAPSCIFMEKFQTDIIPQWTGDLQGKA